MSEKPLWEDQTAIITGGAAGLGFALTQKLLEKKVTVAIFDRDANTLKDAKAQLGENCHTYEVDITDERGIRAAVADIVEKTGRVDILVNCAAITGKTGIKSHEVDLADYDRVMNINVRGALVNFQAVIPYMLEKNYGRILYVASISGKDGNAGMLAYSVSKAAVIGMAKVQGKEYAQTGITINAVAPAVIRTAMVAALPEAQVKYMTDKIPMQRCGLPEEFADLASFIVSPEASFTTGFTYDLTGGRATY